MGRALRRLAITAGAIVGGSALLLGGLWLHGRITPQHRVLVDNGLDVAVTVRIGDERVSLAPHQSRVVRAHDGELRLEATGPGGFHERATLQLPETGWKTAGRTALYNLGGKSPLAVVSVTYGTVLGAEPAPVELLPSESVAVMLPPGVAGAIDEAFPPSVKTSQWGSRLQHVCHVDLAAKRVGCPGAFDEP